ncbi:Rpn family recombination-promoting nuclease/putative transposase [Thiolinea disciformis]|uniref:Rpn family recombination-promoting nuclease/putative transposase n=1 Tax=Thiolinea disciformis TaxID=125614 RepID=UPI000361631D|nr:Rpn family recombination-promoting nuclease/putative transposase [Thiolinea disciformis]
MQAIYLNPLTDFGFKKLFGEEPHKDLLISFLNTLLPERHQIADLQYTKNEYQGITQTDRKAIFDLNCISHTGERFIVELQKVKQMFFKDRSIYYSSFAIQEQAQRGDWDYKLKAVYTIGILDFIMDDEQSEVLYHAQLKDQLNRVFYDKLNFIYLVLPRFQKSVEQLETLQDKWLYVFKHLPELDSVPQVLHEEIFHRTFTIAQLAQFSPDERKAYEDSIKYYRDLKNSYDTAHQEGWVEGLEAGEQLGLVKGREEGEQIGIAKGEQQALLKLLQGMQAQGLSVAVMASVSGLSEAAVVDLLASA